MEEAPQAAVPPRSAGARLSVGSLPRIMACPRRLSQWLEPDRSPGKSSDGQFRLANAVVDAIRAGHLRHDAEIGSGPDLDTFLDRRPPPGLATEEEYRFVEAIDRYADEFNDRPGVLDPRSGVDVAPRPSSTGQFNYTGRPQLLVRAPDDVLELRRVRVRPRPFGRTAFGSAGDGIDADAATAVLLRVDRLRVVELWTVGVASVSERTIGGPELVRLRDAVDARIADAPTAPPIPGHWCGDCPVLGGCPAIAQHSPSRVVGA